MQSTYTNGDFENFKELYLCYNMSYRKISSGKLVQNFIPYHLTEFEVGIPDYPNDPIQYGGPRYHAFHLTRQGYGDAHSHDPDEAREHQVPKQQTVPSRVAQNLVTT